MLIKKNIIPSGITFEKIKHSVHKHKVEIKILVKNKSSLKYDRIKFCCILYDQQEKIIDFTYSYEYKIDRFSEKLIELTFLFDYDSIKNLDTFSITVEEVKYET